MKSRLVEMILGIRRTGDAGNSTALCMKGGSLGLMTTFIKMFVGEE